MAHSATLCEGCGAVDDHPKLHYGAEQYHHDCAPYKVIRDLTTYGYWRPEFGVNDAGERVVVNMVWVDGDPIPPEDQHPQHARALALREAALSGIRGDALREHVAALHAAQPLNDHQGV